MTPTIPTDSSEFVNPFNDRKLLDYSQSIRNWHGYIRFLGLPHLDENEDIRIDQLFRQPRVTEKLVRPESDPKNWPERQWILQVFEKHPRVVLLGDPGSGKSTLVNWLAWRFAYWEDSDWMNRFGRLVPFPMILREMVITTEVKTWDRLLEAFLELPVAKKFLDKAMVNDLMERGQGLVLIDGLDEIGNLEVRKALRIAVFEGFRRFPKARWLLTSRIVGYEEVRFTALPEPYEPIEGMNFVPDDDIYIDTWKYEVCKYDPVVRYICPFDDDQIKQFVRTWFSVRETNREQIDTITDGLIRNLFQDKSIVELARIPNLLTLMALIYRQYAFLPHGRAILYDKICEAYLESIDRSRGFQPKFTRERMEFWLAHVGNQMQLKRDKLSKSQESEREILIARDELMQWIGQAMEEMGDPNQPEQITSFLEFAGRRSGLLIPRGPGIYSFSHLSFQEYFAAVYLKERLTDPDFFESRLKEKLHQYAAYTCWTQTLIFLGELVSNKRKTFQLLLKCLFGSNYQSVVNGDWEEVRRANLLALWAVNPHIGFSDLERIEATKHACIWDLMVQQRLPQIGHESSRPIPTILGVSEHYLDQRFAGIRSAFEQSRLKKLVWGNYAHDQTHLLQLQPELEFLIFFSMKPQDALLVGSLSKLRELYLFAPEISNLAFLTQLLQLEVFHGPNARINDIAPISHLPRLRKLDLHNTPIEHIDPVKHLTLLEWIDLRVTPVRDLTPLVELPYLRTVLLSETHRQYLGIEELKKKAPQLTIEWA